MQLSGRSALAAPAVTPKMTQPIISKTTVTMTCGGKGVRLSLVHPLLHTKLDGH
jgi:hypothetical protein